MCGRYGRRAEKQRIADWFRTHNANVFNDFELALTYNAAPQSFQPVVRPIQRTGDREIVLMKWGLVPYWSKTIKLKCSTINATADKLATSSVWREPFQHRRCLVPADWFYEWPVVDGEKQARAFGLKNKSPFAFAGLWDRWKDKETGEVQSFRVIVNLLSPTSGWRSITTEWASLSNRRTINDGWSQAKSIVCPSICFGHTQKRTLNLGV